MSCFGSNANGAALPAEIFVSTHLPSKIDRFPGLRVKSIKPECAPD